MSEQLYQFAVVKRPTEKEAEEGKRMEILIPPGEFISARSDQEVVMIATKKIPNSQMSDADRIEVLVRPF